MLELATVSSPVKKSSYYQVQNADYDDIVNDDIVHDLDDEIYDASPNTYYKSKSVGCFLTMVISVLASLSLIVVAFHSMSRTNDLAATGLSRTVPYTPIDHPEPLSSLWGSVTKPFPTGSFWTNLVVGKGEGAIGVYPYGVKTLDHGVEISYGASRRVVLKSSVTDPFMTDFQVSFVEGIQSHTVESYDNISVTMLYKSDNNIGKMKTHIVKSSPFMTFVFESTTPVVSSPVFSILSVESQEYEGSHGKQFIITLGNYQKWLLFCSDPYNALIWDGKYTITASVPMKGFVRLAYLPLQSYYEAFSVLMKYVQRYPIGGTVSMSFPSINTGDLSIQYNSVGSGPLLMLALPHHIPLFSPSFLETEANLEVQRDYSPVYSIKGILRGIVGDCWKLTYNLPSISWNYVLTDKFTTDQLDEIALSLFTEVKTILPTGTDPYLFGKQMGRMARLALIADNLGIADARQQAIYSLETSIIPWLQSMNHDILHYDRTYGGIVPSYGLADKLQDFGAGWYSDHHFQFGYFVHVVAVLAKLDMPFYEANKAGLDAFVRDICNGDSSDNDFPFVRHKDLFDGHSWASGLFQQGNGKGQESSSEAINAYYGCALYGMAMGNQEFQRFSQLLTAMEIQSTQKYWHMNDNEIYDSIFAENRMVGNIGALDVTASTWFGNEVEYVHGINMMPLTPITSVLFDVPYVKIQYPVLAQALYKRNIATKSDKCSDYHACTQLGLTGQCCPTSDDLMLGCCELREAAISNEWMGYVYNDLAILNRVEAWNKLMNMNDFGMGNSRANSLFWTASRGTPLMEYNITRKPDRQGVEASCSANTACSAIGLTGDCCPTKQGDYLGCCPHPTV